MELPCIGCVSENCIEASESILVNIYYANRNEAEFFGT